ncbi:MAG: 4Fe-4S dicluster domain-containing protein [Planctomycetota bacterium]|jgi:MauM/NapG family ferredoxin protein|nr:4Fe-4S dicluster domain-containing protein [Planctomycetota bacterium]
MADHHDPDHEQQYYTRRELIQGHVLFGLAREAVSATRRVVANRIIPALAALKDPNATPVPDRPQRRMPLHRPPKAVAEEAFLAGCTKCNDCATACPHQAIIPAPAQLGAAAGTPMIKPDTAACQMCPDMPCVTACEPQVLHHDLRPKMGTARLLAQHCLAVRGQGCSSCVEQCPVEDAIRLERGTPVINSDVCTGCGVCVYVCPAPETALIVLPERWRPEAPHDTQQG